MDKNETLRLTIGIEDTDIDLSFKCMSCGTLFEKDLKKCPSCNKVFRNCRKFSNN